MRVTAGMVSAQVGRDLERALAALARQQHLLATGRRLLRPSDDPAGAARVLALGSQQAAGEQFRRNIGAARAGLASADAAVRAVVEDIIRAKEAAIQGGNDTLDAAARRALGQQVDQLLESLVGVAGSRGPAGEMLFGGQETTRAPWTVTRDAAGRITAVAANPRGIDEPRPAEVGEGLTVPVALGGTEVFGTPGDPTAAFDVLLALRDALEAGDGAAVRELLDELDQALERASLASTVVGTRLGWLEALESRLQDEALVAAGARSEIEDLDLARAVAELQQVQAVYEAGLAAGARLLQQSLLDFLR